MEFLGQLCWEALPNQSSSWTLNLSLDEFSTDILGRLDNAITSVEPIITSEGFVWGFHSSLSLSLSSLRRVNTAVVLGLSTRGFGCLLCCGLAELVPPWKIRAQMLHQELEEALSQK